MSDAPDLIKVKDFQPPQISMVEMKANFKRCRMAVESAIDEIGSALDNTPTNTPLSIYLSEIETRLRLLKFQSVSGESDENP